MVKLMVISTNFRDSVFWKRWSLLSKRHKDLDITLVAPKHWVEGKYNNYTFGRKMEFISKNYEEENFRVLTIRTKQNILGDWSSPDIRRVIKHVRPDYVYFLGHHRQSSMMKFFKSAKKYCRNVRRISFTMRSDSDRRNVKYSLIHRIINTYLNRIEKYNIFSSDYIFCHYPGAANYLKTTFGLKNVYLNTQIGVDTYSFKFSSEGRTKIREALGLSDCYVFGSASRFNKEKGILDILDALPKDGKWKYVILGSGTKQETDLIMEKARANNIEDKVIMPGLIGWDKLPDYLSALDCGIHVPRTTPTWKETFSLALVQMMSVSLPVIGNDSGSVPYQLGPDGIITREGEIAEITQAMTFLMANPARGKEIGKKLRGYVVRNFDIEVLSENFYETVFGKV